MRIRSSRKFFIPEVVQTSAMDCGPASLKCLLEGFGIPVSYGRLREACQTDVDGTSIDTMEEVAVQLGLDAEQVMIPVDHVLIDEAEALPAIAVVRLPSGLTHFVVAWRRHGRLVQVMDPSSGRVWHSCQRFLSELYVHSMPVPAEDWYEWTTTDEFTGPFCGRMRQVGLSDRSATALIQRAHDSSSWVPVAAVDATTRMMSALIRSGGLRRGPQAGKVLVGFVEKILEDISRATRTVPPAYWSVGAAPPDEEGQEQVFLSGAVLVRARGVTEARPRSRPPDVTPDEDHDEPPPLSPELVAALEEPRSRPGRELLNFLRADGLLTPVSLLLALALSSGAVLVEALMFRGLLDLGRSLHLAPQRIGAMALLIAFMVLLLLLEYPITSSVMRLGRHLETRLRKAFLEKIPRLADSYFNSRLTSDMAERSHSIQAVRTVVDLGEDLVRGVMSLLLTAAGVIWLDPASAPVVAVVVIVSVVLPLAIQPILTERDMRVRSHFGALTRFYLDAMLGLTPLRTHGAERAVKREHESLLVEWMRASTGLLHVTVPTKAILSLVGMGLAGWLLFGYLDRAGERLDMLLFVFWALNLPALGKTVAEAAQQYPALRNVTLRLMEPLGAAERAVSGGEGPGAPPTPPGPDPGAAVALQGVSVKAGGHAILQDVDLEIPAGSHVAIVGRSGAGKSTFVGLLLGWHRPVTGRVQVDDRPLDEDLLAALRQQTAWVDPAVQLWNRSALDNLRYGAPADTPLSMGPVIEQADLRRVLENLPQGLQTSLGEGGALVSGGEGQRLRLGRSLLRPDVRLVILDEPFRGLDREQRGRLLRRARRWWSGATLLCVTHDVGETRDFERVLVVEQGRIVEDDSPARLIEREGSLYRTMLDAEQEVREGMWSGPGWRRLWLEGGRMLRRRAGEEPR